MREKQYLPIGTKVTIKPDAKGFALKVMPGYDCVIEGTRPDYIISEAYTVRFSNGLLQTAFRDDFTINQ